MLSFIASIVKERWQTARCAVGRCRIRRSQLGAFTLVTGARTSLISAVMLLVSCERTPPASKPNESLSARTDGSGALVGRLTQGSFAFADSDGTQLLALDSLADPSTIRG